MDDVFILKFVLFLIDHAKFLIILNYFIIIIWMLYYHSCNKYTYFVLLIYYIANVCNLYTVHTYIVCTYILTYTCSIIGLLKSNYVH